MPSKFNEFITSSNGDEIVFASLSSINPPKFGSRIMLVQDGLMGFGAGRMFTVSSQDENLNRHDGHVHEYKGIGEAYLIDDEGNTHTIKAGKEILNNSFILVESVKDEVVEQIIEPITIVPTKQSTIVENVVTYIEQQGSEGIPGVRGPRGMQVIQGLRGVQGVQGVQGEVGTQGTQGTQGEQGQQGIQGEQGEQGEQGPYGWAGEKGDRGEQGDQGLAGAQGERGSDGKDGRDGKDGDRGDQGDRGEQGLDGAQGERGSDGRDGRDGEKGDQGEQGEQGVQGEKGDASAALFTTVQHPLTLKDKKLAIDIASLKKHIGGGAMGTPILYGAGGGMGEAFKTISVLGQPSLTAVQYDMETLTFESDGSIEFITTPSTNTLFVRATGGINTTLDGGFF